MLCQISIFVTVLVIHIVVHDAAVPPRRHGSSALFPDGKSFSTMERTGNESTSKSSCCETGPGYTFDNCAASRLCQYPRFCINEDSQSTCAYSFEEPCHCVPIDMEECIHPSQCSAYPYETCAYLPHDKPYCYSYDVVNLNGSFTIYTGGDCCGGPPTSEPPTTSVVTTTTTTMTTTTTGTYPSTVAPPSYTPPPSDTPSSYAPSPPSTVVPPASTEPPLPSLSPLPSNGPLIPVPLPSPKRPDYGGSPSPSPTQGGRTGDECEPVVRPCISYRECVDQDNHTPCTSGCTGVCINAIVCMCSSDCFDGEVCAGAENQPGRYCFSPDVIDELPWATEYECTTGMTGDPCKDDSMCKDGRTCVQGGRSECLAGQALCGVDRPPCQPGDEYCYCNAVKTCECSDGCDESEVCCDTYYGSMCISRDIARGNANFTQKYCDEKLPPAGSTYALADSRPPYSENSSPSTGTSDPTAAEDDGDDSTGGDNSGDSSSGGTPNGVCVDARALSHIPMDQLVFSEHVLSTVLCDSVGSCATPGHIVLYRDTAMMMKTYCKTAGCSYRRLHVNSPKYRRRLQIPSNTHDLTFTTFAARFATAAEELVLSTIVHAGL